MFLNENDILEIKINNHWNVIDKFIILESSQTHTGDYKPYNFDKKRFEKYSDKVIYIQMGSIDSVIEQNPNVVCKYLYNAHRANSNETVIDWIRDSVQSSLLVNCLDHCGAKDDDVILIDCADEIVSEDGILRGIERFRDHAKFMPNITIPELNGGIDPIFGFEFINYYYKINLQDPRNRIIIQSMMTTTKNLKLLQPSTYRHFGIQTHEAIRNAGWHFGFLDNTDGEMALQKYKSWSHARDRSTNYYENVKTKEDAVAKLFECFSLEKVPLSKSTHPPYLIDNLDKYQSLIYDK